MNFTHTDRVRDYECDAQGIVNNATYLNYCEHARNLVIFERGYNLSELMQKGEVPVVARAELTYKDPLKGGDIYRVETELSIKGSLQIVFSQRIYRENICVLEASFIVVVLHALTRKPLPIRDTIFDFLLEA